MALLGCVVLVMVRFALSDGCLAGLGEPDQVLCKMECFLITDLVFSQSVCQTVQDSTALSLII